MTVSLRTLAGATALCLALTSCSFYERHAARTERVFVSNQKDGTVSVIDGTPAGGPAMWVGSSPAGIAARSSPPLVAVAISSGRRVSFIDPVRLEVVRSVDLRENPDDVAFSGDGKLLFVTLPKAKSVAVVDVEAGTLRQPIRLKEEPKRLAVSPEGHRLYVVLHAKKGGVAVVDFLTRELETTIPTGPFPTDCGLTRDGRRLVTANFGDDSITVIDTTAQQPIATWHVDTGLGIVVHPTKPIAYSMASFDNQIAVVNYDSGKVVATLAPGEFPTRSAISTDGRFLYVVNQRSHNVVKVDTGTNQAAEPIAVGLAPSGAVVLQGP